jgi:hypothetical protein
MLGVLLVLAAPARAATITFGDVVRTIGASGQLRPASEVRLRFGAQSGTVTAQVPSTQNATTSSPDQQATGSQQQTTQTTSTTTASTDPTLSQSGGHVETVDLGDVTGTVCDCGVIPQPAIPKGGFPWWTLAGIPLICVTGICKPDNPNTPECVVNCGPGPTPTPPGVPEPMSLLLFGSGLLALGAGARRRHGRRQVEIETATANTLGEV